MLSHIDINSERQSHYSEWKTCGRCDPCPCERSDERLRDFYRKYAGRGEIKALTGAICPCHFAVVYDIMSLKLCYEIACLNTSYSYSDHIIIEKGYFPVALWTGEHIQMTPQNEPLKLSVIYSPPNHPTNILQPIAPK